MPAKTSAQFCTVTPSSSQQSPISHCSIVDDFQRMSRSLGPRRAGIS
jgi:hypothetical protein